MTNSIENSVKLRALAELVSLTGISRKLGEAEEKFLARLADAVDAKFEEDDTLFDGLDWTTVCWLNNTVGAFERGGLHGGLSAPLKLPFTEQLSKCGHDGVQGVTINAGQLVTQRRFAPSPPAKMTSVSVRKNKGSNAQGQFSWSLTITLPGFVVGMCGFVDGERLTLDVVVDADGKKLVLRRPQFEEAYANKVTVGKGTGTAHIRMTLAYNADQLGWPWKLERSLTYVHVADISVSEDTGACLLMPDELFCIEDCDHSTKKNARSLIKRKDKKKISNVKSSSKKELPSFMTTTQAAKYLNVTRQWLDKSRFSKYGYAHLAPPYIRFGEKMIRYQKSDLDRWLKNNTKRA